VNRVREPEPAARREEPAGRLGGTEKPRGSEVDSWRAALRGAGQAEGYDLATAHDPHFDNRAIWPEDVKRTNYHGQRWPEARLLVWARKGNYPRDITEAGNWLEHEVSPDGSVAKDGRPAAKGPDKDTDLLFPDSDSRSRVGGNKLGILEARHITVGRNMHAETRGLKLTGNMWVREGGHFFCRNPAFVGDRHSFARNDKSGKRARIVFKMPHCQKLKGASIEFIGPWGNGDGLYVDSGAMIVGPGSSFHAGNRHQNTVGPKSTLVLLSGARFQLWQYKERAYDLEVFGTLLAGTPERSLTKDVIFPLCFKTRGIEGRDHRARPSDRGLKVHPNARIAVHSADPEKARLVFRLWNEDGKFRDRRIDMALLGEAELDGVEFNDIQRGGVELADAGVRDQWEHVFFGEGNAAEPDALFKEVGGD
jgi:hypothetical protein